MRITRYTDYSLRVLMYVALKNGRLCTIGEIAQSYEISKNHLMKVVNKLANDGYLISIRGKNGGMRLNKKPEMISIGELVRMTEEDIELVECFGTGNCCKLTPACELKSILSESLEAFFKTLDKYTLEDLLPPKRHKNMIKLLQIGI